MPTLYNEAINRKKGISMGGKIADNKRRICISLRKDLAEQGKELAESEGLTFTALLSRLLALAVKKSKES